VKISEGSVEEFDSVLRGDPLELKVDPSMDRALQLLHEPERTTTDVVALPVRKTDEEYAADLKDRLRAALAPVAALMTEARAKNVVVNYELGWDAAARCYVQAVNTMKPL
jgi:hypothetical protein